MRGRSLAGFAAICLAWALACGGAPTESLVSVPTELAEVQALHDPPDVVVTTTRQVRRTTGGASCGHSPLCLIVLPVLLVDHYFPEEFDEVVAVEGGQEIWRGTFETDGTLLQAIARDGDRDIALRRMPLPELGRVLVLASGSAPVSAAGERGAFVPVTVQSQVDLVGAYAEALDARPDDKRAADRGALLAEAWTWLGAESLPLLEARLSDEHDDAVAPLVQVLCAPANPSPHRGPLLALVHDAPGPRTSLAALGCIDGDAVAPFVRGAIAGLCAADRYVAEDVDRLALNVDRGPTVTDAVAACDAPARTAIMRAKMGLELSRAEIDAALATNDAARLDLVRQLSEGVPEHRDALYVAMGAGTVPLEHVLRKLRAVEHRPDAAQADALARAYLTELDRTLGSNRLLGWLLEIMAWVPADQAHTARSRLEAALASAGGDDARLLAAALVVLGQPERAAQAAAGMPKGTSAPYGEPMGHWRTDTMVAFALVLAGCPREAIPDLQVADPPAAPDPLCVPVR